MKTPVYPCIWFDGNAEEAAEFYSKTFENTSVDSVTPLVVMLTIKGKKFMLLNGGANAKPNPSISFFNICTSTDELEAAWKRLSENGLVMMPLDKYPWSSKYGWVQDRYGVSWQLMEANDQNPVSEVFPSLMFVGEYNGKARAAVTFYTSLFENSSVQHIATYGPGEGDTEGNVKYAEFSLDGSKMVAMESSMEHNFQFDWGVSLVITCDTQDEIDHFWEGFTAKGQASKCGWCQDQFGIWWQVVPSILSKYMADPVKAPKVMDAFLKMTKFDIEAIERAADQQ